MSRVIDLIDRTARQLDEAGVSYGHGTTGAFDEAAWLVLWKLGIPLDELDAHAEQEVAEPEQAAVQALIDQRIASRVPAAYLTREAWLQGVPFYVDERVIVPRSLIAEPLADGTLDAWLGAHTRQVLDLCTGNGSLAVLCALAWPEVSVTAADLSAEALEVARINVERHGLQDRIRLVQGDGLGAVKGLRFDLIVCNPPYVNEQSMSELPAEFRAEPSLALAGGDDGMNFIRPLLAQAADSLTPDGILVLEIGHEMPYFLAAFPQLAFSTLSTSAGDEHVVLIEREALL